MKINTTNLACVALLLALGPVAANAQPVTFNGNSYEVFVSDGISWANANDMARSKSFGGVSGHLATITSLAEEQFIDGLRQTTPGINLGGFDNSELWVGGNQIPATSAAGDNWFCVNGEGAITTFYWLPGEPNDAGGDEHFLAIGWSGNSGWNDEAFLAGIWGYVVEYDGVVNATSCTGTGCPLANGSTNVALPPTVVLDDDDTIAYSLEVVCDDRVNQVIGDPSYGRCDNLENHVPWNIFNDLSGRVLPAHIKGSPCIAVMTVTATEFEIPSDVVEHVTNPSEASIPGIGQVFDCNATLPDGITPDLAGQLLFSWATDDLSHLIEERPIEATTGCINPSRGASFEFSTFYINTHFDFCQLDPNIVLDEYILVIQDKFDALYTSILNSQQFWDNQRAYKAAKSKANQARSLFKKGQFVKSQARTEVLQGMVESALFLESEFNHHGNIKMRVENVLDKVIRAQGGQN